MVSAVSSPLQVACASRRFPASMSRSPANVSRWRKRERSLPHSKNNRSSASFTRSSAGMRLVRWRMVWAISLCRRSPVDACRPERLPVGSDTNNLSVSVMKCASISTHSSEVCKHFHPFFNGEVSTQPAVQEQFLLRQQRGIYVSVFWQYTSHREDEIPTASCNFGDFR